MKHYSELTETEILAACEIAIPKVEARIKEMEAARQEDWKSNAYASWQPAITTAKAVLRGLKNPFRGRESLNSFAAHGGVNTSYEIVKALRA